MLVALLELAPVVLVIPVEVVVFNSQDDPLQLRPCVDFIFGGLSAADDANSAS